MSDNMGFIINKLADLEDFNQVARAVIREELLKTKSMLDERGLPYCSQMQDHWLKLWEYSGAIIESRLDKRMTVLDAGGAGSVLSYYMALEGCVVHTVDLLPQKVENTKKVAEALGLQMYSSIQDITNLDYADGYFDSVYGICVIEHILESNQPIAMKELGRVLRPGGVLAITFDYGKDAAEYPILAADEVYSRLVLPSGLEILGNRDFYAMSNDLGGSSLDYTFGALFLRKPGRLSFSAID